MKAVDGRRSDIHQLLSPEVPPSLRWAPGGLMGSKQFIQPNISIMDRYVDKDLLILKLDAETEKLLKLDGHKA